MQYSADGFPRFDHESGGLIGNRQFRLDCSRRRESFDFNNVLIVDRSIHGPALSGLHSREKGLSLTKSSRKVYTGDHKLLKNQYLFATWAAGLRLAMLKNLYSANARSLGATEAPVRRPSV
jgi:hypothetical protein